MRASMGIHGNQAQAKRNSRRALFFGVALAGALVCGQAQAFDLISNAEVLADAQTMTISPKALPSAIPGAPVIRVISPQLTAPLQPPIDILVNWEGLDGARIDPTSLKVSYGRFRLDITSRLLKYATVSESGLEAKNAKLPAGSHRLLITVSDSQARESSREFNFEVAEN